MLIFIAPKNPVAIIAACLSVASAVLGPLIPNCGPGDPRMLDQRLWPANSNPELYVSYAALCTGNPPIFRDEYAEPHISCTCPVSESGLIARTAKCLAPSSWRDVDVQPLLDACSRACPCNDQSPTRLKRSRSAPRLVGIDERMPRFASSETRQHGGARLDWLVEGQEEADGNEANHISTCPLVSCRGSSDCWSVKARPGCAAVKCLRHYYTDAGWLGWCMKNTGQRIRGRL